MAVTSKDLNTLTRLGRSVAWPRWMQIGIYSITLVLAVLAGYVIIGQIVGRASVLYDDWRYGRPRTMHVDAFVGHDEASGVPTHLIAMNIGRQVTVIELPGGDPAKVRSISGPYLVGADEELTPVQIALDDIDGDNLPDLLLNIRREQIVYLNREGGFRLPTPEEQTQLNGKRAP